MRPVLRSSSATATAAFLAALALAAAPAAAELTFAIPEGFVDISPGKPVPPEMPEALAAMVQSGTYTTYAMDFDHADDGFAENFNAIVEKHPVVIDEGSLKEYVDTLPARVRREIPDGVVAVAEQGIAPIGGQPAIRVVFDLSSGGTEMRMLQYVVSGADTSAALTYTAARDQFDEYLPVFEAAAAKTGGVAAPPMLARLGRKLVSSGTSASDAQKILGFVGKVVGALLAVGLLALGRRLFTRSRQTVA